MGRPWWYDRYWQKQRKANRHNKRSHNWYIPVIVIVLLLCIISAAFAGVQPLAAYKDSIIKSVSSFIQTSPVNIQVVPIATTQDIYAVPGISPAYRLCVELKPTTLAKTNFPYKVDLYEKGKLRDTTSVIWNQPELNVKTIRSVYFPLTQEEFYAYFRKPLSDIFSASVRE